MLETSIGRAAVERARIATNRRDRVRLAHEAHALVTGIDSPAADRIRADAGAMIGAFLAALPDGPAGDRWRAWATVQVRRDAAGTAARLRRWIDARRAARPRPSPAAEIRRAADRIIRRLAAEA